MSAVGVGEIRWILDYDFLPVMPDYFEGNSWWSNDDACSVFLT
jgi:hypothetical protein